MSKIALFGLTGFGNSVLKNLMAGEHGLEILVTRFEKGEYPFYPEENIAVEAERNGVPCYYGKEGEEEVIRLKPDIIFVSTYHRILSNDVISSARYAFNIHPSLLPSYRGASPCFWVIKNGEKETGITVHELTESVDAGGILIQRKLTIDSNETQGSLRKKLAEMAGKSALDTLNLQSKGALKGSAQREEYASYYPRLSEGDRKIDLGGTVDEVMRHINALLPWPGAMIKDKIVVGINKYHLGRKEDEPVGRIRFINGVLELTLQDGKIILKIK